MTTATVAERGSSAALHTANAPAGEEAPSVQAAGAKGLALRVKGRAGEDGIARSIALDGHLAHFEPILRAR